LDYLEKKMEQEEEYLGCDYSVGGEIKLDVIIERVADGYIAYIPHLPGCISGGETPEDAVENLKMLIEDYLDLDFDVNLSISSASDMTREIAG
jgi:predicted RNase H-like HicB family nuclease